MVGSVSILLKLARMGQYLISLTTQSVRLYVLTSGWNLRIDKYGNVTKGALNRVICKSKEFFYETVILPTLPLYAMNQVNVCSKRRCSCTIHGRRKLICDFQIVGLMAQIRKKKSFFSIFLLTERFKYESNYCSSFYDMIFVPFYDISVVVVSLVSLLLVYIEMLRRYIVNKYISICWLQDKYWY